MARMAAGHRILWWDNRETVLTDESAMNISDTVFGFLDEESEGSSFGSDGNYGENVENDQSENIDDEDRENPSESENSKSFWETQNQLLQGTLCRTTSIESKVRSITKDAVKEAQQLGAKCNCNCGKGLINNGCRNCLMKEICLRLQNAGFNSAICKSKWKSSPNIPSGEHTFLDVLDNSKKGGDVRVIIELNFRAEFEMARASQEYNELITKLPEVFVGKTERLSSLIKILCTAAKKCMKDKKMHMGPWRKQRYMQAKWLRTCERTITPSPLWTGGSGRAARPKARSMLTVDLLDSLPNLHRTAVAVV